MSTPSQSTLLDRLSGIAPGTPRSALSIEGFHRAGVLVPLVLGDGEPELLFTQRTEEVETHKGQISFPGGMADKGDGDIVRTALREAEEELGIAPSLVDVKGLLDDLAVPSGFIITPVVGILRGLPRLTPNPGEVAEAFTVPIGFFCKRENGRSESREYRGLTREVWFYQHGTHNIWGATAMIVRQLILKLEIAEV